MNIKDISVPEVYKESQDFRFFLDWFEASLRKIKYDIENIPDIYDPQRCKDELLWMLADTMGYKQDDRLPIAFNRLVLMYFMSMIRLKGSKDGVTLAAETNLAQFDIDMRANTGYENEDGEWVAPNPVLNSRLEDTNIPVNSVYVTPHVAEGYIDVVYFSSKVPIDACIEYVRPVGMYVFQTAGVRFDARTKISVDARLTNINYSNISIGPTHVGHYRRDDYARMQHMRNEELHEVNNKDVRQEVWYRNSKYEKDTKSRKEVNPGYRALYSLQLCNNEHVVKALVDPVFSLGYGPDDVTVMYPDDYLKPEYVDRPIGRPQQPATRAWNLRYDRAQDAAIDPAAYQLDRDRDQSIIKPDPAVNPMMHSVGDAISMNEMNTQYTKVVKDEDGNEHIVLDPPKNP